MKTVGLHSSKDLDLLLEKIGDARVVMLGEASHGTHEFYTWRTAITKRLIEEKGFSFIAVEGDWPDCYRINRFVKGYDNSGTTAREVLNEFNRWPTWMWANWEIVALTEWLHEYNTHRNLTNKAGFYGLDVYSLWESMDEMFKYLKDEDPKAAEYVKAAINCFEPYSKEGQLYARHAQMSQGCTDKVVSLLKNIKERAINYNGDREAALNTEQNAMIAVNAEKYYRAMLGFGAESWNLRDHHMMDTLKRLMNFHGEKAKAIVWEHNTHIGDARATDMAKVGMVNTGQLAREHYGKGQTFLVGFGTYEGSVIAADEWEAPMEEMNVPEARNGSVEHYLHNESMDNRMLIFNGQTNSVFDKEIGHRAIGVVYHPERERYGNYVPTVLSKRYDAFIYLDNTMAVHPLHLKLHHPEAPETFPFGF